MIKHFSQCAVGKVCWLMLPGITTQGEGVAKWNWQSWDRFPSSGPRQVHYSGHCGSEEGELTGTSQTHWARPSFLQRLPATWGRGSTPRGERRTSPAVCVENGALGWSPVRDLWRGTGRGTDDGDGAEPSPSRPLSTLRTRIILYASVSTDRAQHGLWDLIVLDKYS